MEDKSQKISAECWRWFKKAASMEKGDDEWTMLLNEATKLSHQYQDDKLNFPLFCAMFSAFTNHVDRLDKLKKGEEL